MGLTLTDFENRLRTDLNDPAGPNQRFAQGDLDRAIDRAVDKYSFVNPVLYKSQMATAAQQRTYPMPGNSPAGYPPWWIESVEYPSGRYPPKLVAYQLDPPGPVIASPGAVAPAAVPLASSTLPAGTYWVRIAWRTPSGTTLAGPTTSVVVGAGQAISVSVPAPPLGGVQHADVYAGTASGSETLQGSLSSIAATPTLDPALGGTYVQQAPLVAGAALPSSNTTGQPTFTLKLRDSRLPADATGIITVVAAYKHQLDATASTIPEQHNDVVLLGAYAYCCYAWGTPMADNFLFSDGELRDRLDDTRVPVQWLKQGDEANARFRHRLEEIKRQRDAGAAAVTNWGDIPSRWDRL